jgi:hypothetical protein
VTNVPTFCPECESVIPLGKYQCKCGAKIPKPQRWMTKEEIAENTEATKKAEAFCNAMGLCSTEEKRAYIKSLLPQLSRQKTVEEKRAWMHSPKSELARQFADEFKHRRPVVEREPGADYEEDLAA